MAFEDIPIGVLLDDLRSVKLGAAAREQVDRARDSLQRGGAVPVGEHHAVYRLATRHARQLRALYEARDRARRTNGRMARGITSEEAANAVEERRRAREKAENDLGF